MKKILLSSFIIVAVASMVVGGTQSFFSDVETSTGNKFVAGSLDLTVDHTYAMYNDEECVSSCIPDGDNLIVNGGFEEPELDTGDWEQFTDDSLTSWVIASGTSLEIQNNADGDPYEGEQLAELASDSPSAISQAITTVPGEEYRLTFQYSPRPNRPVGDNTIGLELEVVGGGDGPIFTDTIMDDVSGSANTAWTEYEYNFIAVNATTTLTFSALGNNVSHGGYLDAVSITALDCNYTSYEYGGTCVLWGERNLGAGDTFWTFNDVKPGDFGRNIISLHVFDNNALGCAFIDYADDENELIDPEEEDGDNSENEGELSGQISFFAWVDDGDNVWEDGEPSIFENPESGVLADVLESNRSFPLGALNSEDETLIGLQWCFGDMTVDHQNSTITCDGNNVDNTSQTDILSADLAFYIEQARNNEEFDCADIVRE